MSYKNRTYVIFDGDKDQWAYRYMKGWKNNHKLDFDFEDAHDISPMTSLATDERYVKSKLRERFRQASQVIVLIGESTRYLYGYVRWELEVALELNLPIIAINLNDLKSQDELLVPPIIKDEYVVHIPFKMKIIKYALDNFPPEYNKRDIKDRGPRVYNSKIYNSLEI